MSSDRDGSPAGTGTPVSPTAPPPTSSSKKAARCSWRSPPEPTSPCRSRRTGGPAPRHTPSTPTTPRRRRPSRFRPEHDSIGSIRHQQPREPVPDRSGRTLKRAQPAADRRDRSSATRGDPPVAPAPRGLRLDRSRDHLSGIGPPYGQPHLQQHMRAPAARAPRPARPTRPARPIRAEALPNNSCSSPYPRA